MKVIAAILARGHEKDRRRTPRIGVGNQLRAVTATGIHLNVLNLSYGGCLVASASPFFVGSLQQFSLETLDRSVKVVVTARVVHTRLETPATPEWAYVTGFLLLGPWTAEATALFDSLMDAVTSRHSEPTA